MSIKNQINRLKDFPQDCRGIDTIVVVTKEKIHELERVLGFVFPKDYKEFLLKYNGIGIPGEYVYGITGRKYDDLYLNVYDEHQLGYSLDSQENCMPNYLIPFCPNGRGDHYCFHKEKPGVYFWQHDLFEGDNNPDYDCDSFTQWLSNSLDVSYEVFVEGK